MVLLVKVDTEVHDLIDFYLPYFHFASVCKPVPPRSTPRGGETMLPLQFVVLDPVLGDCYRMDARARSFLRLIVYALCMNLRK
jgi:hypothetical protein